jgi:small conductance mechanosensitive channel
VLPIGLTLEELRDWALDAPLRIALVLIGAAILSRLSRRAIKLGLRRAGKARTGQRLDAVAAVLASAAGFTIWLIAVFTVLAELKLSIGPLLAGAGVAGIAVGFGAQALVRDFLAGAFILIEDQFAVGDRVEIGDAIGVVETIGLRTTRLRSDDGTVWYVPNGAIAQVGNHSQHTEPDGDPKPPGTGAAQPPSAPKN